MIGILNNRRDRGRRAGLFASMVPKDNAHHLDHVTTFGAHEETVTRRIVNGQVPRRAGVTAPLPSEAPASGADGAVVAWVQYT